MTTVQVFLACAASVFAILFGFVSWQNARSKRDGDSGRSHGVLLTDIVYIKSGVDDIKHKQDKQDEQLLHLSERMTSAEASTKQAHHRLDRIERSGAC